MAINLVDHFLSQISSFLRAKDATSIRDWLKVEPPLPNQYYDLQKELQQNWKDDKALAKHIDTLVPEKEPKTSEEGDAWPGFQAFLKDYMLFWRDISFDDLPRAHRNLSLLVKYALCQPGINNC